MPKSTSFASAYGKPKNSKKQKTKKSQKSKTKNTSLARVNRVDRRCHSKICNSVCSQVDPFCEAARGAKRHDMSSANALASRSLNRTALTTDASGRVVLGIHPNLQYLYRTAATYDASGNVLTWDPYVAAEAYAASGIGKVRIVTMGVRFFASAAPSASGGIASFSTVVNNDTINVNKTNYMDYYCRRLYQADMSYTFKEKSDSCCEYSDMADTSPYDGWNTGVLTIVGPPNVQIGFVEITIHLEMEPLALTNLMLSSSKPWGYSPELLQITDKVRKEIPAVIDDERENKTTSKTVFNVVSKEVARFIELSAPYAVDALIGML